MMIKPLTTCQPPYFSKLSRGAVMAEFIIITGLVLMPLMMGVMYIGKSLESKQKMEIASRYSGWERTVWYEKVPDSLAEAAKDINQEINTEKSMEQIAHEIENRIFANQNASIYIAQNEDKTNETADEMTQSFWFDDSGGRVSIYKADKNNEKSFINGDLSQKDTAYGMSASVIDQAFTAFQALGNFDLNLSGAYTSTVDLTLKQPDFLEDVLKDDLKITKSYTILTDGWNAAGPAHAKRRVKGLVLFSALDSDILNKFRYIASIIPITQDISSSSLKFGHVEVEAVPSIRLAPYKNK